MSIEIKTRRLVIRPMTVDEIHAHIELYRTTDPELSAAYSEMLAGSERAGQYLWCAPWLVSLSDGSEVGDLCFKGFEPPNAVEIGYGILPQFQGRGYATEAVAAMCRWAFEQDSVTAVEAEVESGNLASLRVIEKCGFVPTGEMGAEGSRYILKAAD